MNKLPIFYRPEQSTPAHTGYSPSAGKPALVVQDWLKRFPDQIQLHSFEPASRHQLYQAHRASYVDAVLDCKQDNGFGTRSPAVAATLPYTSGSLLAAAKHVLTSDDRVACSPTSGFHHAHFSHGGGFCTFNGLMVAALELRRLKLAQRILILDFDQHFGDGTDDIIRHHRLSDITHISAGQNYTTGAEALACADLLSSHTVCTTCSDRRYDLILYQAGADIHVDDPLGGRLTTEQMRQRDFLIFNSAQLLGIPLVWNLAGGYQFDASGTLEPVLKLHRQTLQECLNHAH